MENKLIEGKIVSDFIKEDLKIKTAELKQTKNITPCLAVMLVGEDQPQSLCKWKNKSLRRNWI